MIEITVKIANTKNFSMIPSGKEFYFDINKDTKVRELSGIFHETIHKVLLKNSVIKQECWKYDLYTYKKQKMDLQENMERYFTTDNVLDLIDRNETIVYAILAS